MYDHRRYIILPWKFLQLISELRRARYDLVFDTKDVLSFNNALLSVMSGGAKIVGYGYEGGSAVHDIEVEMPPDDMYEPRRHLQLLNIVSGGKSDHDDMEVFLSQSEIDSGIGMVKGFGLLPGEFVGIHCGGRGRKEYGVRRFFAIARELYERQRLKTLFIYGPDEAEEARDLGAAAGITMASPSDIRQLASLINQCKVFLGGDTGALHIAAALGKPTISLFIGSNRARYAPKGAQHIVYDKLDVPPGEEEVAHMITGILSTVDQ